jgi:RimJ/RimL family protein N-acetyltransferase
LISPIFGADDVVASFAAMNIEGCERGFGKCAAIGFADENGLFGAAIYHNYCPEAETIELTAVSTRKTWATRETIKLVFGFPFERFNIQLLAARTSEKNKRALSVWRALGADFYPIPRLRDRNTAEIITTLTAEQWQASKFKERTYGKT